MFEPGLIALDLDGTLLTNDKSISAANQRAVRTAIDAGCKVVLASGRMHEATCRYAHILEMSDDTPVISYNGASVRTVGGEAILERPLDPHAADYLIEFTKARGLHLNYYLGDVLYVTEMDQWSKLYQSRTGSIPVPVADLSQFRGQSPTKLIIVDTKEVTNGLLAPMLDYFGDGLYITKTDDEYLEFMNPTASKATALHVVADRLGVPQSDVVAFGDNLNDIPMLEWAGWSIAMDNAKLEVKRAAREVGPSADSDGVASGIARLLAREVALV